MAKDINMLARNTKYKILTPSGWSDFEGVNKTQKSKSITIFTKTKSIEVTLDHKMKTQYGFIEAQHIGVNHRILTENGYEEVIETVKDPFIQDFFYDPFNVKLGNEYYSNGLVSHNCMEFMGSSGTLISGATLKRLKHKEPLMKDKNGIKMYEEVTKAKTYVCVVDVSRGKGLDYSAFHIIDVSQMPYKQVFTFRSNLIPPTEYVEVIFNTCKYYNNAVVLIEINDIGGQVADLLHDDYEYEYLLFTETAGRAGKKISSGFGANVDKGIRTTKTVKSVGCSILKLLIEQEQLILNDFETIKELTTFSRKNNSYEAEPGCHDDLTMGLVLFAWLSDQQYFKELTDIHTLKKLRERSEEELMEELLPFGFHVDAVDEAIHEEKYKDYYAIEEFRDRIY